MTTQQAKPALQTGQMSAVAIDDNFTDLHPPFSTLQAMAESNRCLYCYDAPCVTACPTSIDIPSFIRKISTGNPDGAAKTILSANIMGGTCARACPTEVLCEQACVRNVAEDEAVEIGSLQRYAVDHLMARNLPHPFKRAAATGKKIAVIGAGPAGLSCAHRAAMLGHDVTVFEAKPKPGGLNEYGLAAYIFGGDLDRVWTLAERMEFGAVGVNVNDTSDLQAPFGGWKMSGFGRELGPEGLDTYLQPKHLKMRLRHSL